MHCNALLHFNALIINLLKEISGNMTRIKNYHLLQCHCGTLLTVTGFLDSFICKAKQILESLEDINDEATKQNFELNIIDK